MVARTKQAVNQHKGLKKIKLSNVQQKVHHKDLCRTTRAFAVDIKYNGNDPKVPLGEFVSLDGKIMFATKANTRYMYGHSLVGSKINIDFLQKELSHVHHCPCICQEPLAFFRRHHVSTVKSS